MYNMYNIYIYIIYIPICIALKTKNVLSSLEFDLMGHCLYCSLGTGDSGTPQGLPKIQ